MEIKGEKGQVKKKKRRGGLRKDGGKGAAVKGKERTWQWFLIQYRAIQLVLREK